MDLFCSTELAIKQGINVKGKTGDGMECESIFS